MNVNDPARICPICGKDNNCQYEQDKCWCQDVMFPKALLDLIPDDKKGKACICKSCLEKYQSKIR